MDNINLMIEILSNDLGYFFIDEYSTSGSDINMYKFQKRFYGGNNSYTYESYFFYADYKTGEITSVFIDDIDKEKFDDIRKKKFRTNSLDQLLK